MKMLGLASAVSLTLGLATTGASAQHYLLDAKACSDLHLPKNAKMVRQLQSPPKNQIDVATHNVIYSTMENLSQKAKKARSAKVDASGFSPLFVLGDGRKKRALMYKSKSECIWVKVK